MADRRGCGVREHAMRDTERERRFGVVWRTTRQYYFCSTMVDGDYPAGCRWGPGS
jgi:hypothetical protein